MLTLSCIYVLIWVILGLVWAIPSNTCIVIVNLESIRKKEKLSPSDVIFLAKGVVNLVLQALLALQGMLFVFSLKILRTRLVFDFVNTSIYLLVYYSFWLTAWLSIHYCTSITKLSHGFFIWLKGMVTNSLGQTLFLTALGLLIVNGSGVWDKNTSITTQSSDNSTDSCIVLPCYFVNLSRSLAEFFLGFVLPICLSLLCFAFTFAFLLRHVRRVKNNCSGSTRPNLQGHVQAMRTIFFLLFIFTFFFVSQMVIFFTKHPIFSDPIAIVSWNLRMLSPSAEAAVIFQGSNKLKKIIPRRFWTASWRNTET